MNFIQIILTFFGNYQIELMSLLLFASLMFRWFTFRQSKKDQLYFSTFSRELIQQLEKHKTDNQRVDDVDKFINHLMTDIQKKLPARSFRIKSKIISQEKQNTEQFNRGENLNIRDYLQSKQGLAYNIQNEVSVFQCNTRPQFSDLTKKIMSMDPGWNNIFKFIPIESVSRMIDIIPGLFIVLGVFGTFIGVSMALPEIAKIDFQNIGESSDIMTKFISNISFSMNTSIAGIFYSIILTVLNTLFPIKDRRNSIIKEVEGSLEALWYHIHKDSSTEKQVIEAIHQLIKTLQKTRPELSTSESTEKDLSMSLQEFDQLQSQEINIRDKKLKAG